MSFKKGDNAVCVVNGQWEWTPNAKNISLWNYIGIKFFNKTNTFGPKFNEVVTIEDIADTGYLYIKEYPIVLPNKGRGAYNPTCFEPLVNSDVLSKAIEEALQHTTN